ncbi:MAG: hypothetical protein ACYCQJ_01135 [Nitrososphaerales archaeon]
MQLKRKRSSKKAISEIIGTLIILAATLAIGVSLLAAASSNLSFGTINQSNNVTLAEQQLQERLMVYDVRFHTLLTYSTGTGSSLTEPFTASVSKYLPTYNSFIVGAVLSNVGSGASVSAGSKYTLNTNPTLTNGVDQFAEYNASFVAGSATNSFSISGSNTAVWYTEISTEFSSFGSASLVHQNSNQISSGSSITCALTSVTSGNTLVVFVGVVQNNKTITLSDTQSNSFTLIGSSKSSATTPSSVESAYYTTAKSSGTDTITVSISSGTPTMFVNCMEISGVYVNAEGMGVHLINYGLVYVDIVTIYANLTGTLAPLSNFTLTYPSGVTVAPSYQARISFPFSYVKGSNYKIELVSSSGSTFTSDWSA